MKKRIWIDTAIGTSPDDATALLMACKHPDLELVGVSISGTQQEQRMNEARQVLEYGESQIQPIFGEDLTRADIEKVNLDHLLTLGPLTNIARLVLEETHLPKLHIQGGAFTEVLHRGEKITAEKNIASDKDASRVVLTQCEDVTISTFEITNTLILDLNVRQQIEQRHPLLKNRYGGFEQHLKKTYGEDGSQIFMQAVLPICDILNTPTIRREVIEFYIQPDGSFRRAYPVPHRPPSIPEVQGNPDCIPVPLVKHEAVVGVSTEKIFDELLSVL